jgi:DNA-binding NarL/FixJ family response regulator
MPVCDGYEANKRISCSPLVGAPPPLVVALTANTDKGTRDLVVDEGFFAFLSKPLNVTALGTVLAQSYSTTQEAGHGRRGSSTSQTGPGSSLNRKAPMPSSKTASPPSMVYLDVFVMGC